MNQAIFNQVKALVVENLEIDDADKVVPQSSFADDLGADSLDIVELVMALEEAFGIEIPDEDAERIGTVGDAAMYIDEKTKGNA